MNRSNLITALSSTINLYFFKRSLKKYKFMQDGTGYFKGSKSFLITKNKEIKALLKLISLPLNKSCIY